MSLPSCVLLDRPGGLYCMEDLEPGAVPGITWVLRANAPVDSAGGIR